MLLLEAKAQVKYGQWTQWLRDNFSLGQTSAYAYMKLANQCQFSSMLEKSTLSDVVQPIRNPATYAKWHEPVKHAAETVNVERMNRAFQAREAEAKLTQKLGLKLIDIGYKVLATKLHPDKGGSSEAMTRLAPPVRLGGAAGRQLVARRLSSGN